MGEANQFLIRHGLPLVLGAVFLEQLGLPIPAVPWLLAAGALSATGQFNLALGLGATVLACIVADAAWFYLGRYHGNKVLGLLCRISLEPDSCVRRTQNVFTKYGLRGVLVAKFVPGMSTVAPPLAGMAGTSIGRFLIVDAAGSLLYGACFLALGYFFSNQIEQILVALARVGGSALSLLAALAVLYLAYKYWQRQRLLSELRTARITVDELRQKLDAGEEVVILDLRSTAALEEDAALIPGAIHMRIEDLELRQFEIPRDRDVILYCSCPNEASSARVALRLQRKGFTRVRPLLGGIDAWKEQAYRVDVRPPVGPSTLGTALAGSEDGSPELAPRPLVIERETQPSPARQGQTP